MLAGKFYTTFKALSLFRRLTIDLVGLLVLNLGFWLGLGLGPVCWCRKFRLKTSMHSGLRRQRLSFFELGRIHKFNSSQPSNKMGPWGMVLPKLVPFHTPET